MNEIKCSRVRRVCPATKSMQNSKIQYSRETETINYEKVKEKENERKVDEKGNKINAKF